MNTKEARQIKVNFPFSLYFKQLFAQDTYVRFINPFSFWRRHRIEYLETCCELNTVQYLESCYNLEWRSSKSIDYTNNQSFKEISSSSQVPSQQISLHKIIIVMPSVELKYRGVAYRPKETLNININNVEFVPGIFEQNIKAEPESISIMGIHDPHKPLTETELIPPQLHCGQLDCNIPFPKPIQVNHVRAELIDGVLTITMPKVNIVNSAKI
jgi:HSP20 family protein